MHADMLADDELHARQPNAGIRHHRGMKREVGVAQIDHDFGFRQFQSAYRHARHLERYGAGQDRAVFTIGARHGDSGSGGQRRRGVLGADDGGNTQFARDDGGVAGAAATIGDDRAGGLHHRFPVRAGGAGDQHLTGPEIAQTGGIGDDAHDAGADLFAHCLAARQHRRGSGQRVAFEEPGLPPRRHGFRPRLHDVEQPVVGILRPFDVHRLGVPGARGVMILDADRAIRQVEHLRVAEAEPRALRRVGRNIARAGGDVPRRAGEPQLLLAKRSPQHRPVTLLKGRLMHEELVRIDGALDDVFAESVGAGDEDDVAEAGLGVQSEDDPAARAVRTHHLHDADRQ